MPFLWFSKNDQKITTTLNHNHLTLNSPAVNIFESIDRVRLGCDPEKRLAVIELLDLDAVQSYRFKDDELISISTQSSYVRINCTAFVDLLIELMPELALKVFPLKFETTYDNVKKMFYIDFNKEV